MKFTATWNPARGAWETAQMGICGHLELFSQTWPTSGMTQGGMAFELPTWERPTGGSGSSLLPTPRSGSRGSATETVRMLPTPKVLFQTPVASEGAKPSNTMGVARRKATGQVFLTNEIVTLCGLDPTEVKFLPTPQATNNENRQSAGYGPNLGLALLPTPGAYDAMKGGSQHPEKRKAGGHQVGIADVIEHLPLLPTPDAGAGQRGVNHPDRLRAARRQVTTADAMTHLLPTPTTADGTGGHKTRGGNRSDELLLAGIAESVTLPPGEFTGRQSSVGNESSDGQPPAQPNQEETTRPASAPLLSSG